MSAAQLPQMLLLPRTAAVSLHCKKLQTQILPAAFFFLQTQKLLSAWGSPKGRCRGPPSKLLLAVYRHTRGKPALLGYLNAAT